MIRQYGKFVLQVDKFKSFSDKYQFWINTPIPAINTNKDFDTPEEAFKYAEEIMKEEFTKILKQITHN